MTVARPARYEDYVNAALPLLRNGYVLSAAAALAVVAITLVMIVSLLSGPVESADPFTIEPMKFTTNAVAGTTNDEEVELSAKLYVPKTAHFPISAMIIVPSSSGVEEEREVYYAKELAKAGIGALVIDSFTPRGLTDSVYDQSALDSWEIENDAIAGLDELVADKRFKGKPIGIMGVSKGGSAAMNTALTIRRQWMGADNLAFAAHVAISPDCTWVTRRATSTGAPVFFMLAENDDQTPATACLAQAARMTQAGNKRIQTKVYKGASHAWEELGPKPEYDAEAENYAKCRVWIEDDGKMVSAETGQSIPEDDWHTWAQTHCMTLGTHSGGGTPELKETATQDIIAFLKRNGF